MKIAVKLLAEPAEKRRLCGLFSSASCAIFRVFNCVNWRGGGRARPGALRDCRPSRRAAAALFQKFLPLRVFGNFAIVLARILSILDLNEGVGLALFRRQSRVSVIEQPMVLGVSVHTFTGEYPASLVTRLP